MLLGVTFLCLVVISSSKPRTVPWRELRPPPVSQPVGLTLSDAHSLWNHFLNTYNISADDASFSLFYSNLRAIGAQNQHHRTEKSTFQMGVNYFAAMHPSEFRKRLGYRSQSRVASSTPRYTYTAFNAPLPSNVDWRRRGFVTPVKDQGSCGSCWAFSATGSLEGQLKVLSQKLVSLSEQQLVDCSSDFNNAGCSGGFMDNAFEYIKSAGGLESEKEYPYVSGFSGEENTECLFNLSKVAVRVEGYVDITSGDVESLMEAVALKGPISIGISAGRQSFMLYHSGIYDDPNCDSRAESLDHGVLLVGYGEDRGVPYWIIKNSWGPNWGEAGYIRIKRSNNLCGVATAASYPVVLSPDAFVADDSF